MNEAVSSYLWRFTDEEAVFSLLAFSVGRILSKQAARGENWNASIDDRETAHIVDWLRAALANKADWLAKTDDLGRPKKLMKFGTIGAAIQEADKAMRKDLGRYKREAVEAGHERLVISLSDGMELVEMLTPAALDRESTHMQHCIGGGGYDEYLGTGERVFYSIRDEHGSPHVTFEINSLERTILQTRGKQNQVPNERYMALVKETAKALRFQITDTDFVLDRNLEFHQKSSLPAHLGVFGSLNLSGKHDRGRLPEILSVELDLDIYEREDILELPRVLSVGRHLYADGTGIIDWRELTMIVGTLNLSGSKARMLAETLSVGEDLVLAATTISKMPNTLWVGGNFYIHDAKIRNLPSKLKVGGTMYLQRSNVTFLSPGLEVGTLDLRESKIGDIPPGVIINGDLVIDQPLLGGTLKSVSRDLQIGGNVKVVDRHYRGETTKGYYDGRKCEELTLDQLREFLDSDFVELPF